MQSEQIYTYIDESRMEEKQQQQQEKGPPYDNRVEVHEQKTSAAVSYMEPTSRRATYLELRTSYIEPPIRQSVAPSATSDAYTKMNEGDIQEKTTPPGNVSGTSEQATTNEAKVEEKPALSGDEKNNDEEEAKDCVNINETPTGGEPTMKDTEGESTMKATDMSDRNNEDVYKIMYEETYNANNMNVTQTDGGAQVKEIRAGTDLGTVAKEENSIDMNNEADEDVNNVMYLACPEVRF